MLSFGLFVSVACAQSLSNRLLIISPDSARFTVRISGYQVNKTPGSRVVCKGIYLSQAPVQIIFADTTYAPIKTVVSFAPNYKKKINVNNLLLSMTIHNFPEGMAIGVAFAGVYYGSISSITAAISLAIGIGIQNFPEGSAISFPLYKNGYSKFKSFVIGGLTAIVEPIGGVIGVLIALRLPILLPFLLSLAAGSMFYVIVTELVPEAMQNKNKERMALYLIIGFIIMMFLDISLG